MKSEFASLTDLAGEKGLKTSELIDEVQSAILKAFFKRYPDQPKKASVNIDAATGRVRIYAENKDITPSEFVSEAESLARRVILSKIEQAEISEEPSGREKRKPVVRALLARVIFLGYNAVFLVMTTVFFLGLLNKDFRTTLIKDLKDLGIYKVVLLLLVALTPLATVIYAIKAKLGRQPGKLMRLFFLLEIPLISFAVIPLSMSQQTIAPIWFFSFVLLLVPFVLYSLDTQPQGRSTARLVIFLGIHELVFLSIVYLTLLVIFYIPIILGSIAEYVFSDIILMIAKGGLGDLITSLDVLEVLGLLIILALGGFGLLIVLGAITLPFLIDYTVWKRLHDVVRLLTSSLGKKRSYQLVVAVAAVYLVVMGVMSYQPDRGDVVKKLEEVKSPQTFEERQAKVKDLAPKKDDVRKALLDAYEARQRYPLLKDSQGLSEAYQAVFDLDAKLADYIQRAFLTAAYPFVYQGEILDSREAAEHYEYVFGEPYKEAVARSQTEPAVLLVSRTVRSETSENGLFATVTIEEEYENTTNRNQEVIYEFSLSPGAVITDLKLGPNLEYQGIIAPKGAAQRTYERELLRSRDPALLEQTGPRQYRLRVFPIPGKNDRTTLGGKNQKVAFTYVVPAQSEGYPFPDYSKKTNVSEGEAQRTTVINGRPLTTDEHTKFLSDPMLQLDLCDLSGVEVSIPVGSSVARLIPHNRNPQIPKTPPCASFTPSKQLYDASGLKIAIYYDLSHNHTTQALKETKELLERQVAFVRNNSLDLYLFNDLVSQPIHIGPDTLPKLVEFESFGQNRPFEALKSLSSTYDVVVIFTGDYELLTTQDEFPTAAKYPVYLIHPQAAIPPYHLEFTTQQIQSGGKVVESFAQAVNDYLLQRDLRSDPNKIPLDVNAYWSIMLSAPSASSLLSTSMLVSPEATVSAAPTTSILPRTPPTIQVWPTVPTSQSNPASYLVSRGYLEKMVDETSGDISTNFSFLDAANDFASRTRIISPFSSLLSLVNQRQLEELERQSRSYQRYRESVPRSLPGSTPIFDGAGRIQPLFGRITNIPMFNGGGGSGVTGGVALQAMDGGGAIGGSLFSLAGLFIAANITLFIGGATIFLIYSIRKSKKPTEEA